MNNSNLYTLQRALFGTLTLDETLSYVVPTGCVEILGGINVVASLLDADQPTSFVQATLDSQPICAWEIYTVNPTWYPSNELGIIMDSGETFEISTVPALGLLTFTFSVSVVRMSGPIATGPQIDAFRLF